MSTLYCTITENNSKSIFISPYPYEHELYDNNFIEIAIINGHKLPANIAAQIFRNICNLANITLIEE